MALSRRVSRPARSWIGPRERCAIRLWRAGARHCGANSRRAGLDPGERPPVPRQSHHGTEDRFYLDQRENRALLGAHASGRDVLNGFAYTGAFGVYAGWGGARCVTQVESSASAIEEARENWSANGLPADAVEFVREDVYKYLRETDREFDVIILDPPPYAKAKGSVDRAARAYKDLNLWALRRLRPGGLLFTFSCSQHMEVDLFQKVLFGAAHDARASCQWLRRLGAGCDHPVHLDHPQGEYLKGFLLRAGLEGERT